MRRRKKGALGSEFLSGASQTNNDCVDIFERACPEYMAMGMPLQEYWDGDCELVRYYRRAFEIRQKQKNHELWLQGLYVHEAVAIAIGNAFRKNGGRVLKYSAQPYAVTRIEQREEQQKEVTVKPKKMRARFENIVAAINAKFKSKEASGNGNG